MQSANRSSRDFSGSVSLPGVVEGASLVSGISENSTLPVGSVEGFSETWGRVPFDSVSAVLLHATKIVEIKSRERITHNIFFIVVVFSFQSFTLSATPRNAVSMLCRSI